MGDKNKIRLDENTERFVREFTGMTTPKVLERIAEYFRGVTPIQHCIEMAVTNGRGYLEKGDLSPATADYWLDGNILKATNMGYGPFDAVLKEEARLARGVRHEGGVK